MGCGSSSTEELEAQPGLSREQGGELLEKYLRLDREIWREERIPPIPCLGHNMLRLERLNSELESAVSELSGETETLIPGSIPDLHQSSASALRFTRLEGWDDSIRKVMKELNINRKADLALEHEEFIANLNRKAMKQHKVVWLNRRKQEAKEEVARLSDRVQNLQTLYQNQEAILGSVGAGGGRTDGELERLRSYRDTLVSGELGWVEGGRLAGAAGRLAGAGLEAYKKAQGTAGQEGRLALATEARDSLHEAALCLHWAQTALPGVQFPYCSSRELQQLTQVLEYIYTDMQVPDRYSHATQVFHSFHKRSNALYHWIKKMRQDTIHKDIEEVESKIVNIGNQLSSKKADAIRHAAGLGSLSGGQDPNMLMGRLRDGLDRKLLSTSVRGVADNSLVPPYR